jgi:hypothetical protein
MDKEKSTEFATRKEIELGSREETAWEAVEIKYQRVELQKPLRDREYFKLGEIGVRVAREQGLHHVIEKERQLTIIDLFEWATRGEFDEENVVMLVGLPPELYALFLPEYHALRGDPEQKLWVGLDYGADRPVIEALSHQVIRINIAAIILRRAALLHYLGISEHVGAARFLRELTDGGEVATPENLPSTAPPSRKAQRGKTGPKTGLQKGIEARLRDDLRSEYWTPATLKEAPAKTLILRYGGSESTVGRARRAVLEKYAKMPN